MLKVLLTNDDGIDAPGLNALWHAVRQALSESTEVVVVAPDRCRSECGHSITSGRPFQIREVRPGWYSIDGTPVDCVRVGLSTFAPGADMVFSGVNAGANLGVDLLVSGTFAAAREAAVERVPAMAVSHYRRPNVPKSWEHVPRWLMPTLVEFRDHVSTACKEDFGDISPLWNVNLPAIDPQSPAPPTVRCAVDTKPHNHRVDTDESKVSFTSDFHARPRENGSDVERCFSGSITISEVSARIC